MGGFLSKLKKLDPVGSKIVKTENKNRKKVTGGSSSSKKSKGPTMSADMKAARASGVGSPKARAGAGGVRYKTPIGASGRAPARGVSRPAARKVAPSTSGGMKTGGPLPARRSPTPTRKTGGNLPPNKVPGNTGIVPPRMRTSTTPTGLARLKSPRKRS